MLVLLHVNLLNLLPFGGLSCHLNPTTIPSTWSALKTAMRVRFVPPTYQRDLLKNLTRLEQGKNSVEEYYQELQTWMVRCGLVESTKQILARFFGGLNKDIKHILDYKEYNSIIVCFILWYGVTPWGGPIFHESPRKTREKRWTGEEGMKTTNTRTQITIHADNSRRWQPVQHNL